MNPEALTRARENLAKIQLAASRLPFEEFAAVEARSCMLLLRARSLSTVETLAFALASAEMLVRHLEEKNANN